MVQFREINKNFCSGHCECPTQTLGIPFPASMWVAAKGWHLGMFSEGHPGVWGTPLCPTLRQEEPGAYESLPLPGAICIPELPTDSLRISLRLGLGLKQSPSHFSLCPFPSSLHCLPWEQNFDTSLHTSSRLWKSPI